AQVVAGPVVARIVGLAGRAAPELRLLLGLAGSGTGEGAGRGNAGPDEGGVVVAPVDVDVGPLDALLGEGPGEVVAQPITQRVVVIDEVGRVGRAEHVGVGIGRDLVGLLLAQVVDVAPRP